MATTARTAARTTVTSNPRGGRVLPRTAPSPWPPCRSAPRPRRCHRRPPPPPCRRRPGRGRRSGRTSRRPCCSAALGSRRLRCARSGRVPSGSSPVVGGPSARTYPPFGGRTTGKRDCMALPTELQVEVTAACNLRCEMCLVAYRPPLDRAHNSFAIDGFRDLLDELPDLQKITLQGLGEPLLAPDLFAMIAAASERGIRVGFNTNATVLTRRKAERLVAAGLDWLHVSLDGATAATYEAIRKGSSFERVHRNVLGLVDVMRETD